MNTGISQGRTVWCQASPKEIVFEILIRGIRAVLVAWGCLAWNTDACRSSGESHPCMPLIVSAVDVVFVHLPEDAEYAFTWYLR